jgi:hypothetical protein
MSTNIQLLRSSIANKRPAPATLLDGQAAVNLNSIEPGLYFKLSNGILTKIGPVAVNSTGNAPNSTPAGSAGNAVGELWMDGRTVFSSPVLKVYNGTIWQASNGFTVDDTNGNFSISKQITARNFIAEGTGQYSYNKLPSGPSTDEALIASPQAGYIRFDTTRKEIRVYDGTSWEGATEFVGDIIPSIDNTYNLGSPAKRWANVYTGDLHLENDRGSWTMIEEETYLSLRNNRTGKTYKLQMEEVTE